MIRKKETTNIRCGVFFVSYFIIIIIIMAM